MRICFVCRCILPLFGIGDGPFGGAEVQIHSLARYLVRNGFDVDVVVGSEIGPEERTADGIRLIPGLQDTSAGARAAGVFAKRRLLGALKRSRADVYVATCASPDIGIIGLYARLAGKPFVYRTSAEIDCDGSYERQNGWRGRLFGSGLRSADAVVAQHDRQRALLASRGIEAHVIHNSFDFTRTRDERDRAIDVLWVGRCDSLKDPESFVLLARALPHRSFVMICPPKGGSERLFEAVRNGAAELSNLTFIERVGFAESQGYFERSKLLVGTSHSEGFPNTYLQACGAGTPIVSYRVDPGQFIERNGVGVVARGDFDRLREETERLLIDPGGWEKCSGNARAYVERMHDRDVEGTKWATLLRSLRRGTAMPKSAARAAELV